MLENTREPNFSTVLIALFILERDAGFSRWKLAVQRSMHWETAEDVVGKMSQHSMIYSACVKSNCNAKLLDLSKT